MNRVFSAFHMVLLARFATPFCCGVYGTLVCRWIPHSRKKSLNFLDNFSFVVGSQGLDLHAGFIMHQCLVCIQFVKHLSFRFQKLNTNISQKVIEECDKVSCSTTRCCLH